MLDSEDHLYVGTVFSGLCISQPAESSSSKPSVFYSNHATDMLKKLNEDRKCSDSLCDITIHTSAKDFEVHKCVLGVASDFFRKMFTSNMRERNEAAANITDVSATIMEIVIEYMYTCRVKITDENVYELLEAADYFQLDEIKNFCSCHLQENISEINCIMKWSFARRYNIMSLVKLGELFIKQNFLDILKSDEVNNLSADDFAAFLELKKQNVREFIIYNAVISWMKYDEENRKEIFSKVFKCIDFRKLQKDFLQKVVCEEKVVMSSLDCTNMLIKAMCNRVQDVCDNEEIVILGGVPWERNAIKYNATDFQAEELPQMSIERSGACVACVDRCLYIFGGHSKPVSKSYNSAAMLKLDEIPNSWVDIPAMSQHRRTAGCAVLGDYIYVCGGKAHDSMWLSSCERFNIQQKRWYNIPDMVFKRSECALVALNGRIYAIGGCNRPDSFLETVECYDPKLGIWGLISPLNTARAKFAAVVLHGKIYAIGGEGQHSYLSSVERYNPLNDTWVEVGSLKLARFNHGACVVNEEIYALGGINTVEVYNESDDEWIPKFSITRKLGAAITAV
ncbi:unnamed protein product [Clavelina lepadiformis]|uniref:BTB domain-containing protein n=1 Tax=Clavelina lepadiformis TaxID=159417 RepID=A0ABP0GYF7_CLALP